MRHRELELEVDRLLFIWAPYGLSLSLSYSHWAEPSIFARLLSLITTTTSQPAS